MLRPGLIQNYDEVCIKNDEFVLITVLRAGDDPEAAVSNGRVVEIDPAVPANVNPHAMEISQRL